MKKQINKQGKKVFGTKNKNGKNFVQINNEIFDINEGNNINYISNINNYPNIDSKYRKQLNDRMDEIMKKIDKNINSNNSNQFNMIIHNSKINYINNYNNNSIPENIESEEKDDDNNNNITEEKIEEETNPINNNKNEIISPKNINNENDNKEKEIINKLLKRNKYLENELNYYKYKLNKIEGQKGFVQDIIKNDTYIKRHLFDIFIVDYYKKIALNWKEITNELIDELLIDEIHELTKIKLKLRHINRLEEEKEHQLNAKKELSPIDIKEFILFNDNINGIKQTIKSVKESEKNLCKKYKVKVK